MLRLTYYLIILFGLYSNISIGENRYLYTYKDRTHTLAESSTYLLSLYSLGWLSYYIGQPDTFVDDGSFKKYRKNMPRLVFDQDEPIWNFVIHPLMGSQVYLFYRANGYSRVSAISMTCIQSALFEFFTEVYTEPPSIQDLYHTPILGAALGFFLETLSLSLINSDLLVGKVLGHIINPSTLFWFYEGRVQVYPSIKSKKDANITLLIDF